MADNLNLDSTAEALDALMKIKASSSPSLSSIREQSRVNPDGASILNSSTSCDSMATTLNTNIMQSSMQQQLPISAAPVIQGYALNRTGLTQEGVQYNFPIGAPSISQHPSVLGNLNSSTARMQPPGNAHTNMQSYVMSSMAAYLNTNNPSTILPKSSQKNSQVQQPIEVRTDEVERALRSKPQRGKKRNNLNNDERKELTRSRNRLHAKTTRQRKKARYDELIECEQKYLKLMEEKKRSNLKKQAFLKFLAFCTQVLNSQQPAPASNPNDDLTSSGVSSWKAAFGRELPDDENRSSDGHSSKPIPTFDTQDLFEAAPIFSVTSTYGTCHERLDLQGLQDSIHDFARDLSEMLCDEDENNRFMYVVPNSIDGIAMSDYGFAFSTFHIVQSVNENFPLSSGLVEIRFAEQSHKIAMAKLHTTFIENGPKDGGKEASSPPLGGRDAFPSVVSLEKKH